MKKLASLVLATIMVLAMAIPAAAAGEGDPSKGSITITSPQEGHTYTIYKILKLESYNKTDGTYAYKLENENWRTFLDGYKISVEGVDKKVFNIDTNNYVTIMDEVKDLISKAEYIAPFAKAALAHATSNNNIQSAATPITYTSGELKFTDLELGYYLVDSNLGTLCGLTTTNPDIDIKEKNGVPELKKEVQEDSKSGDNNNEGWGDFADADRGQVVNFKVTITAKSGAQKYVLYDKMESGLKFDEDSVVITKKKNGTEVPVTLNTDYNVYAGDSLNTTERKDWTFKVVFTELFCDALEADDEIIVTYSAMVKEEAMIVDHSKNTAQLKYGDNSQFATQPSEVTVRTWEIPIFKYSQDGESKKGLAEATFTLYRDKEGKQPIQLISVPSGTAGTEYLLWRVATPEEIADETKTTVTEITTDSKGHFVLRGLDSGTYYLREIAAPEGYNKLPDALEIKINTVYNETEKVYESQVVYKDNAVEEVEVLNQSGSLLPTTGGIGTTIFYVVGGILVAAAVVLLVTRKRMSTEK